ncbi:MAG: ABC transporter substrate-binding protein, partial [Rhodospirillales bacterium]|nr:ABC transporter substrate-binding protein [Rhodospirillales bacterium]
MSRMMLFLVVFVALAVFLAFGMKSPAQFEQDGRTLRFASTVEADTLDPHHASWMGDLRIIECLYETLLRTRPETGELEPATASEWSVSEDGLIYTFIIREDARWSNGDPVTSNDFLVGWRRGMLPDLAASYSSLFFHIKGAEDFFNWRTEQLAAYAKRPASQRTQAAADELWQDTKQRFDETVGISAPDD